MTQLSKSPQPRQTLVVVKDRLVELELVISSNLYGFYEVGKAFQEIRDEELYKRDGHKTFKSYCRQRWELNFNRIKNQISSAETADAISDTSRATIESSIVNEANIRPLVNSGLPLEQQREIWQQVLSNNSPITDKVVSLAVKQYKCDRHLPDYINARTGKIPKFSPIIKPMDNWNFTSIHYNRIDDIEQRNNWGYIPGEIYCNCFWFFAKPGDTVVVPMAGSGQAQRVYDDRANWMRGGEFEFTLKLFDYNPRGKYKDLIGKCNLVEAFPVVHADYIFMDIPYFGMVEGQYSESESDLANQPLSQWIESVCKIATNCYNAQQIGGLCTVMTPNYANLVEGYRLMTTDRVRELFVKAGYTMYDKAYSSRKIQQRQDPSMARINNQSKERRVMLTDITEILTFRK